MNPQDHELVSDARRRTNIFTLNADPVSAVPHASVPLGQRGMRILPDNSSSNENSSRQPQPGQLNLSSAIDEVGAPLRSPQAPFLTTRPAFAPPSAPPASNGGGLRDITQRLPLTPQNAIRNQRQDGDANLTEEEKKQQTEPNPAVNVNPLPSAASSNPVQNALGNRGEVGQSTEPLLTLASGRKTQRKDAPGTRRVIQEPLERSSLFASTNQPEKLSESGRISEPKSLFNQSATKRLNTSEPVATLLLPAAQPRLPATEPRQTQLSRHSMSLFGDAEIKDLNEPFIDNHQILKIILQPKEEVDLSRRQLQRIIHNYSHYQNDQEKQMEYQRLCSTTYCMGLKTFESDELRKFFYRRIFDAVIFSVKNRYACNSMAVIEVLRMFIDQNVNSTANVDTFPWNRIRDVIQETPPQLFEGEDFEVNTSSSSFELFVKELGSLIKVQKLVLVHIFQNLHKRRSLMDLLRRHLPKTINFLWESLKLLMDNCSEAVMSNNTHLEEVYKADAELILRCLQAMVQDDGRKNFHDDIICSLIKYVGTILVEVPHMQKTVFYITVWLLHLDAMVDQLHAQRRRQMDEQRLIERMHILRKKPELLEQLSKSDIPMFQEVVPILEEIINNKIIRHQERSEVHKLEGGFWIDWLELWLHGRRILVDQDRVQISNIVVAVLKGSADRFWEAFESKRFTNIKRLIINLYRQIDRHYFIVIRLLEALLKKNDRVFVRELFNNMGRLFYGEEGVSESPIRQLSDLSLNTPKFSQKFLGFIVQIVILQPWQTTLLQPHLNRQGGTVRYLVNSLCANVLWKKPQTYVDLLHAINKLMSEGTTFRAVLREMVHKRIQDNSSYFPCLEFLFAVDKQLISNPEQHINLIRVLNEHLDLVLILHETGYLLPSDEEATNWLETLLEWLALRRNRAVSLRDIYIALLHINELPDNSVNRLLQRTLSRVNEQDLLRFLLPTKNESFFGGLYLNNALASFMFRGGKSNELKALIDSLKILKQGSILLSNKEKVVKAGWNDLHTLKIINDNLLTEPTHNVSSRPSLLTMLANLIVLDKSSSYLMSLEHEDVSVLALQVLNCALFQSTQKDRVNQVLFQNQQFRKDIMMFGNENSLKSLLFDSIDDQLKQQQPGYIDTLVFLTLLIDKQPQLAHEIFIAMQLSIETALLMSVNNHQERLIEVGLGLLVTISSHSYTKEMFAHLFKTSFFLEALIKVCTIRTLEKPQPSMLLPALYYLIIREIPDNDVMDEVVAGNFSELVNPQLIAKILRAVSSQSIQNVAPSDKIKWRDDSELLRLNQAQVANITPLDGKQLALLCYEGWCKLCLIALHSSLRERDHIALVIQPNSITIRATMKELARQLPHLGYLEPAMAVLSSAIDKLQDAELAAQVIPYVEKVMEQRNSSETISDPTKMLLLTLMRFTSKRPQSFCKRLDHLMMNTSNFKLLLLAPETAPTKQLSKGQSHSAAITDQLHRMMFRCIGESSSSCLEKVVLPIRQMIVWLQDNRYWKPNYLLETCNFIQQAANSKIPTYESGNRSSMHIVWCWCLLLTRQLVLNSQTTKEGLDILEVAVTSRLQVIISSYQKKQPTIIPIIHEKSIGIIEELNLLASNVLAFLTRGRMTTSSGLLYRILPMIVDIAQPVIVFSPHEQLLSRLYPTVEPPSKGYSMLDLAADNLTVELLELYLAILAIIIEGQQPVPADFVSQFEIGLYRIMDKPTNILYRVSVNKPSVQKLAQKPPLEYLQLSRALGYLNTTQPTYSFTELVQMSNCLIQSVIELVTSYIRIQVQKKQPRERVGHFCYQFYQSILEISAKYSSVFLHSFLDKLTKDLQAALAS